MRFWKRKKSRQPQVEDVFRKMTTAVFPDGEHQIALETAEVAALLEDSVSQKDAREILVHAKGRALIALRPGRGREEAIQRCADSVHARARGKLDRTMAEKVAFFAFQRLIDQQGKPPLGGSSNTLSEMTKEEALKVSRVTAYRLARHQGRTVASSQKLYNIDPVTYITETMCHFLIRDKGGIQKKIETERDARELTLDIARMLVLAHYAGIHGTDAIPDSQEVGRLAMGELELTLSLLREKEAVRRHSGYDPSEARAADEMQVPFDIALTLGEIGLLKDPPGPTDVRRKILRDVVDQLGDCRR
ncbi:MAG: hypothetical protein OXC05_08375 [Halieaceae bacterium]|nr:hypothetical protein [Halieaceae bacterium]